MKKIFTLIAAFFVVSIVAQPSMLFAHDIWLDQNVGSIDIRYGGHSSKPDPYDPQKIKMVKAFDEKGKPVQCKRREGSNRVSLEPSESTAAIIVQMDNGYWINDGKKWIQARKGEYPNAKAAERTIKETKLVRKWSAALAKPLGLDLEIVPLDDACSNHNGSMKVQVIWKENPLPSAKLIAADKKTSITNNDGVTQASCPRNGDVMLEVEHSVPAAPDPDADNIVYTSTLRRLLPT